MYSSDAQAHLRPACIEPHMESEGSGRREIIDWTWNYVETLCCVSAPSACANACFLALHNETPIP